MNISVAQENWIHNHTTDASFDYDDYAHAYFASNEEDLHTIFSDLTKGSAEIEKDRFHSL